MTLLVGRLRGLIGGQVAEVDGLATFLAPANAVHALRKVGVGPAVLCIASPGVKVGTYVVEGVRSWAGATGRREAYDRRCLSMP